MVTTVPAIYSASLIEAPSAIVSEAHDRVERLARNLFALNSLAAATVVVFLVSGLLPTYDKSFVAYLTLFLAGLTCAVLAMMINLSANTGTPGYRRPLSLGRLRRSLGQLGAFWLLFLGLLCFVAGAASGLVALSTSPTYSGSAARPDASAVQPALTGAAVGYWEEELTGAMLAGDRLRFLQSCDRLDDLQMRPEICNVRAGSHGGG